MKFILCNYRIARKSRTFPIKIDCFSDLLFSLLFCSDLLFCDWYSIILAVILLWQLSGTAVILLQPGLLFCMWWLLIFLFTNLLFCSGVVFSFRDRCYIALTIFFICQLLIFSLPVILFVTLVILHKMLSSYDQLFCLLQLLYLWWTAVTGTVLPSLVTSLPNSSRRRNSRKPRCSSLPTNRYQIIFMVFFSGSLIKQNS